MSSEDKNVELLQGTLCPAPVRMEQKGRPTRAGEGALAEQAERWRRLAGLVDKPLLEN